MKKIHLPFLLASLLLTSCNMSNDVSLEKSVDNSASQSSEVASNNNEQISSSKEEEIEKEAPSIKEEQPPVVEEEPTVIEENNEEELSPNITIHEEGEEPLLFDNINIPKSPVYRPQGTVDVATINLNVRSSEATITDSGRVNQKMDIVYLDYNYGGLEDLGYYWLDVKVTLTAREVNDGYQYLFLYNTSKCQSSGESLLENFIPCVGDNIKQGMLIKEQFEIGPGYRKTSYEEREFRFYIYVGNMVDNLYLRYGANGFLADTWVNKDIKVSVTPKMSKN